MNFTFLWTFLTCINSDYDSSWVKSLSCPPLWQWPGAATLRRQCLRVKAENTGSVCSGQENRVISAKHQLEAQIARWHVQSRAAGKTRRWQPDVRVHGIPISRYAGAEKLQHFTKAVKRGEVSCMQRHFRADGDANTKCTCRDIHTHIFWHCRYMHMALKTLD